MPAIRRILCATDFSQNAAHAVAYAEQLAADMDAELYLAHAFDNPATFSLSGQEHPRDTRIQQDLDAVLANAPRQEKIHRVLHAGLPGEVICWLAQDRNCDLIVLGTHGRTGLKHLLFGSIAEHVLRHARCPVLTIRELNPHEPPLSQPLVMPVMAPRYM
jgi:universal stress protein A